jgi:flagellar biosynthesis/type III secretory pathway chaperone
MASDPLEDLEQALRVEQQALIDHDVEALVRSTQSKIVAIRALQSMPADSIAPGRVTELNAMNQANHALLARRRREVAWTLRHLGRVESSGVYDASGQADGRTLARRLGVG